jgi:hypothetical protein
MFYDKYRGIVTNDGKEPLSALGLFSESVILW